MMAYRMAFIGYLGLVLLGSLGCGPVKIQALIVDGQSNHDWITTTDLLKQGLIRTNRFTVEVATTPGAEAPATEWAAFRPDFFRYDVVLSNYNDNYPGGKGSRWPREVEKALEDYVAGGGGLVIIHAANNAFPHWEQYNRMIGLGWRTKDYGYRVAVDDNGKRIQLPPGEGPNSSHGDQHSFLVTVRDPEHPIEKGIPTSWMHAQDELYHAQRGPAENMHILSTAYSDTHWHGTGMHEPMEWVVHYGKGRVYVNMMGHCTARMRVAIQCVGLHTLVARGAEWAATGKVTIPVPDSFPTADRISLANMISPTAQSTQDEAFSAFKSRPDR